MKSCSTLWIVFSLDPALGRPCPVKHRRAWHPAVALWMTQQSKLRRQPQSTRFKSSWTRRLRKEDRI